MSLVSFPQKKSQLVTAAKSLIEQGNYFAGIALLRRANTASARLLTAYALADMGMIIPSCEELYSLLAKGVFVKQSMKALQSNFDTIEDNLRSYYYGGGVPQEGNAFCDTQALEDEESEEFLNEQQQPYAEEEKEIYEYAKVVVSVPTFIAEKRYDLASEHVKWGLFRFKDDLKVSVLALQAFYLNGEKQAFKSLLNYLDKSVDREGDVRSFCEIGMALGNVGLHKEAYEWLSNLDGQEDYVKYFHVCIPYAIACYNTGEYERAGLMLRDCETFVPNPVTKYYTANYDFVKGGGIIKEYCTDIPKEKRAEAISYITSFPDFFGIFSNKKLFEAVEWALYSSYVADATKKNFIFLLSQVEGARMENYLKKLLVTPSKLGFNMTNLNSVVLYALLMKKCDGIPVVAEGLFYNLRLPKELPLMLKEQTALALSVMGTKYVLSASDILCVINEGEMLGLLMAQRNITASSRVVAAYLARIIKDENAIYPLFGVEYSKVADFSQQIL